MNEKLDLFKSVVPTPEVTEASANKAQSPEDWFAANYKESLGKKQDIPLLIREQLSEEELEELKKKYAPEQETKVEEKQLDINF